MTIRRIAMQAATANLTAGKSITVDANGLLVDGTSILDANGRILSTLIPTKILSSYWHASYDEKTVVAGTWGQTVAASQTDVDTSLTGANNLCANTAPPNDLDEIHFGSITLLAGTYKVLYSHVTNTNHGKGEILIGTTQIGLVDCYSASGIYNVVSTFTFSPTTPVTGNLRFRVNGKHASATAYYIDASRIEIIRTG